MQSATCRVYAIIVIVWEPDRLNVTNKVEIATINNDDNAIAFFLLLLLLLS